MDMRLTPGQPLLTTRSAAGAPAAGSATASPSRWGSHAAVRLRTLLTLRLTSASSHLSACLSSPSSAVSALSRASACSAATPPTRCHSAPAHADKVARARTRHPHPRHQPRSGRPPRRACHRAPPCRHTFVPSASAPQPPPPTHSLTGRTAPKAPPSPRPPNAATPPLHTHLTFCSTEFALMSEPSRRVPRSGLAGPEHRPRVLRSSLAGPERRPARWGASLGPIRGTSLAPSACASAVVI